MDNATLFRFLEIKEQIKLLEKELKPIQDAIIKTGNMETDYFLVQVKVIDQNRTVGCEELLDKLGLVKVEELGLIKRSNYSKVEVKLKIAGIMKEA